MRKPATKAKPAEAKPAEAKPAEAKPKTMSVPEFGKLYLGMSEPTAYAAANRGDFPVIRIGKLIRVPIAAAEAMMLNAKPSPKPEQPAK